MIIVVFRSLPNLVGFRTSDIGSFIVTLLHKCLYCSQRDLNLQDLSFTFSN